MRPRTCNTAGSGQCSPTPHRAPRQGAKPTTSRRSASMRGRSPAHSRDRRWRDRLWPRSVEAGPRVVVPLGMHRSGLSVATALIYRLGVPVDEEGRRIVAAHDRLFARFGSSWMRPRLTTPLPETWHRDVEVTAIRRELVGLLREALSRNRGLWAFNDPRTVRFLPLWQ